MKLIIDWTVRYNEIAENNGIRAWMCVCVAWLHTYLYISKCFHFIVRFWCILFKKKNRLVYRKNTRNHGMYIFHFNYCCKNYIEAKEGRGRRRERKININCYYCHYYYSVGCLECVYCIRHTRIFCVTYNVSKTRKANVGEKP